MLRHASHFLVVVGATAIVQIILLTVLAAPANAQRYAPGGPATVIWPARQVVSRNIGTPALPEMAQAPKNETQPAPPAAFQLPSERVVRFRCDLAPGSYECAKPGSADGVGDDEKCNCARDRCRINRINNRLCEKLR